jgi:predicted MPP superfamily phosphohydrolase
MTDLWRKRLAIELGELTAWTARGRKWNRAEKSCVPRVLLSAGLRLTRLQPRGERNALSPILRPIPIAFDNLPKAFSGFTILHLSDLHIDGIPQLTEKACQMLGKVEADLCVLTGDYRYSLNGPSDGVYVPLRKILASVRARHGALAILGNHDTSEMGAQLAKMGAKVLVNEAMELRKDGDSLWLLGLDDPHYFGCEDLPGVLRTVPEGAFKILLVHSPEIVDDAAEAAVDLYLCGHTHGGQICLPGIGPVIVNSRCPRVCRGGAWRYNGMKGYTSFGLGCSVVPARFLCPPEIALIELRRVRP